MSQPWIVSLTASGSKSGWFVLSGSVQPVTFSVIVSGTNTTVLEVSNDLTSAADSKADAETIATYTASTGRRSLNPAMGRLFRFRNTAYTSGTAVVSVGQGRDTAGQAIDISVQSPTSSPTGLYS